MKARRSSRLAIAALALIHLTLDTRRIAAQSHQPERHATLPIVSPDGRRVAFLRDLANQSSEIYLVDMDGTHERLVKRIGNGGAAGWSRNGRELLYERRAGDTTSL